MIRFLKIGLVIVVSLAALLSGVWLMARRITEQKRTQWKVGALERLEHQPLTNDLVRAEIDKITTATDAAGKEGDEWVSDHVLLMTNGEFIVYEYRHGRNDYFPPHLFLGHASNGQWLYSSYHFCNHMEMIRFDKPPGSLAEFSKTYFVRAFDGKSDECLNLTP
jgi:hypothetical protein